MIIVTVTVTAKSGGIHQSILRSEKPQDGLQRGSTSKKTFSKLLSFVVLNARDAAHVSKLHRMRKVGLETYSKLSGVCTNKRSRSKVNSTPYSVC